MRELKLKAMAKINLGLDVLGKRDDGYHELRMIMQTIRLYDRVQLTVTEAPGIRVKTNLSFLPVNEDNLVYRAANLLMEEFQIKKGLFINLEKHIPVAAGLAGGSSDAAAVLVGVNRLFHLGLAKQELMERGVKLGADVPYCVMRGTALAEGIGEKLTPLPAPPACHVLIAKPKIHVSTKFVYGNLRANELETHPDIDGHLETVTIPAYPVIEDIKKEIKRMGAVNAMMSGSGPTVFGLFDDRGKARKAYEKLKKGSLAKQVYLTEFFGGNAHDR